MWKWISVLLVANSAVAQVSDFDWERDLSAQDLEHLQDELSAFEANPLAINSASIHELSAHPLISMNEAINIRRYIDEAGALLDWGELCEAHGITGQWIEVRKPYLRLNEEDRITLKALGKTKIKASVGVQLDDPTKRGYLENEYLGKPFQIQGKLEVKKYPYSFNWRWQQDAGEPLRTVKKGFVDHHSFNFQWRGGRAWLLSIGDYRLGHSTGVLFGSGFGSVLPQNVGQIHAYYNANTSIASASEFGTYRGFLGRYHENDWKIQMNLGRDRADARLSNGVVESYPSTGNHRTTTELQRRESVTNRHAGIYIEKTWSSLRVFWASHLLHFDKAKIPIHFVSSLGGQYIYGTHFLDAEVGIDNDNRLAFGLSYSKSFGDLSIGTKVRSSEVGYQPSVKSAQGQLFAGGGERSAVLICDYAWKSHSMSASAYRGVQREEEWQQSNSRGWQLDYKYRDRRFDAASRIRRRNVDDKASLYLRNHFKTTLKRMSLGLRSDLHWDNPREGTALIAITSEFNFEGGILRTDLFYFNSGLAELPVWLMMRTTSMQMSVLRFSKPGLGINVYCTVQINSRLKAEMRTMVNREFYAPSRGSGLDETLGGVKWAFNFELHYALR